jgi:hypothetical protein
MLASLLYPYDDDAPKLIEGWLSELEREFCIRQYEIDSSHYLEIINWLKHQKIDKPTKSRLPAFVGASRTLANPREPSATDLGPLPRPRTVDLGPEEVVVEAEKKSVNIIAIFDNERASVFGEENRRPFPNATDLIFADRWLASGATADLCQAVFHEGLQKTKSQDRQPPKMLKYFDQQIADAIAERNRPPTNGRTNGKGNGHGKEGPATGIARGFAAALAELNADSGADHDAPVPLLGRQRE